MEGGEVWQIDADGHKHPFTVDLGRHADCDESWVSIRDIRGKKARVGAWLYYDEFADRVDWHSFADDITTPTPESSRHHGTTPAGPDRSIGAGVDPRPRAVTEPRRRHREPLLVSALEAVVIT
ncbi:hypothetical protein [Nocardia thraciensis]